MEPRRESRILRTAVVLLFGVVCGQVVATVGQTQRLPGPGSGVVDVNVINDARVTAAQSGEWRVTQLGTWAVTQQGAWRVTLQDTMPSLLKPGRRLEVRWPGREPEMITVTDVHSSGWALARSADGKIRWVNLPAAISIDPQ